MMKRTSCWNLLAKSSYQVEFRDSQNFTFFEATGVVRGTWHILSGSRGATCHVQNYSNMRSSVGHRWTHGMIPFDENPKVEG